jgi:hypothetical protein
VYIVQEQIVYSLTKNLVFEKLPVDNEFKKTIIKKQEIFLAGFYVPRKQRFF